MQIPTIAAAAILALAGPAQAADEGLIDGKTLSAVCSASDALPEAKTMCLGYVTGVWESAAELSGAAVCGGDGVSRERVAGAVTKFMADNPELLVRPAYQLVIAAIYATWPCGDPT